MAEVAHQLEEVVEVEAHQLGLVVLELEQVVDQVEQMEREEPAKEQATPELDHRMGK